MSIATEILLQDAADALRGRVANIAELSPADRAFLAWSLREDNPSENLPSLAATATMNLSTTRSYQELATLGYAANAYGIDEDQTQILRQGLNWLSGRKPEVAGEPASFFTDAVALLGLAFGARFIQGNERNAILQWMLSFVPRATQLPAIEPWQKCFFSAALCALGSSVVSFPTENSVADVRTAFRARSVAFDGLTKDQTETDERLTLESLKHQAADKLPIVRAALRLAAFSWICRSAPVIIPGRIAVKSVTELLRRVPAGLHRWCWEQKPRTAGGEVRKWYIDNEYHVQDLLYFLMAPIFPDLKDEENLPSVGPKKPRTDLFIPSMKLIIEVKFLRSADKTTKIVDEIGSDASLYLKENSDYEGLIAFVWDASQRTEEHALLQHGLLEIRGVLDAIIISRPGRML